MIVYGNLSGPLRIKLHTLCTDSYTNRCTTGDRLHQLRIQMENILSNRQDTIVQSRRYTADPARNALRGKSNAVDIKAYGGF